MGKIQTFTNNKNGDDRKKKGTRDRRNIDWLDNIKKK